MIRRGVMGKDYFTILNEKESREVLAQKVELEGRGFGGKGEHHHQKNIHHLFRKKGEVIIAKQYRKEGGRADGGG